MDVPSCTASGYAILKGPVGGLYSVAYRLDTAGTETLIKLGRQLGKCSTCTGSGKLVQGLRAEVKGVVTALGSGSGAPTIKVTSARVSNGLSGFCKVSAPVKKPAQPPVKRAPTKPAPPIRRRPSAPRARAPVRRVSN
jgi:hypothetical protein